MNKQYTTVVYLNLVPISAVYSTLCCTAKQKQAMTKCFQPMTTALNLLWSFPQNYNVNKTISFYEHNSVFF